MFSLSDTAIGALFSALKARLSGFSALWGDRVFLDEAPLGTAMPYLIYQRQGGGAANQSVMPDALIVVLVKAVAANFSSANACAWQISKALDDAGYQDLRTAIGRVAGWQISTITEEESLSMRETTPDSKSVYHVGALYRVRMGV